MCAPTIPPDPESPYARFLAERAEINRHKWIASQKESRDIGFERALTEWATHHRTIWLGDQVEPKKRSQS